MHLVDKVFRFSYVTLRPMFRLSLIAAILATVNCDVLFAQRLNILYYGNSLTLGHHSSRSVPYLIDKLAIATGNLAPRNVDVSVASTSLLTHSMNNLGVINTGLPAGQKWDYVVLQDRSHIPAIDAPGADLQGHRTGAVALYEAVSNHSPSVVPVLFQTWARAASHSWYPTYFSGPAEMQQQVRDGYELSFADINAAAGSPVAKIAHIGDAFEDAGFPSNFYASDAQHGANRGTLLASLVLYGTIYKDATTSDINLGPILTDLGLTPQVGTQLTGLADGVLAITPPPNPIAKRSVLVHFGLGLNHGQEDGAGNVWNQIARNCTNGCGDITSATDPLPPLSSIPDLLDSGGTASGISLSITDPLVNNTQRDAATLPAFTDPENDFVYEHGATGGYHFGRLTSENTFASYTLSNLAAGVSYDLTILSARNLGTDVMTDFTIRHGGVNQLESVNSGQNGAGGNYELLKFQNLTADANGQINIDLDGSGINTFINFLRLDFATSVLKGDYNNDGTVDALDYTVWRDNLGGSAISLHNRDSNNTGPVSMDDYEVWKANFGMSLAGSASGFATAVPEPTSFLSCAFALIIIAGRFRRVS